MSLKIVHRPTRTTVPVTAPEPESIAPPPPLGDDQGGRTPLQMLLPIVGAMTSVVMMVVMRNGQPLFMVVAALVFVVAIVGGIGFAVSSRGRAAKQERAKRELYLDYLEKLRRDLAARTADARRDAAVMHPEPSALMALVRDPRRLWERRRRDADFLTVRVGTGAVPWFDLTVPPASSPMEPHDPILLSEARLIADQVERVEAMPVTVDLRDVAVMAVVGDRAHTVATVRSMLLQLAAQHGPDDLSIAAAYAPDRSADWQGLDLLPHVQDPELFDGPVPARRVAPDLSSLAHVLGSTLTDRLQHAHSSKRTGSVRSQPSRLLVVVDDHGRRASTLPVGAGATLQELGVTVVHLLSDRLDEPSELDVRITLDAAGTVTGTLTTSPGTPDALDVSLEPDQTGVPLFESTARAMAAMRLSLSATQDEEGNRTLDIYELLGIDSLDDVDPETLWRPRSPAQFLNVPFATDDQGYPVRLDLKESAQLGMGPHGICIGATGSGKSEMLRTLILSLALTHPPEDLSMILVDYKGGAAFAPFAGLPHLAGLIDNLADDPQLTTRARASIQGEVVRRQRMLKEAGSSPSISHYRQLRAERPEMAPMPHLFVVIDEFGELLTAEPDFIDLFLQIGRIGRSIGVHLLLSSQRIEGGKLRGLDTYLSYRLGLRTFSEPESQVVLSTPDAYHLPALPGYGYLKVDTSVYTRFRSGFVSGPVDGQRASRDDETEARPLLLPTFNGISTPGSTEQASATPSLTRPDTSRTFVDESVHRVRDDDRAVSPVWLPPLPDRLALGLVLEKAGERTPGLSVVIGLEDDPTQQSQAPWRLDLARAGGHVAVIGAPQTGRSTLLRTIAASLSLTYTPRDVAVYGMDLTGGGLQRIEHFPHVGGVATRSHRDRLFRLVEELSGMLALRESVFKKYSIDSMVQLRSMHAAGRIPELDAADIVLLVDGYGQIRQDFEEIETAFTDIMTRAASFGIHLVVGLTRWSELRMGHQALFGTRVELRLNDPAESSIDRKLSATLSADTPGRAILDTKNLAQVALPVLNVVGDDAVGDELEALARRTAESWSGPAAAPIRLLPLDVDRAELPDAFDEPDVVPIGLRQDTMEAALWELTGDDQHLVVLGDSRCGKTTLLRTIAKGLIERFSSDELAIAVVDPRGNVPDVVEDDYLAAHAKNATQARGLAESIASELEQRPGRSPEERAREPRIVVLIDDYDIVSAGGADPFAPLMPYMPSARDLGLHVVLTRPVAGASRAMYSQMIQVTRDTGGSILLMSGERSEGQLVSRIYPERFPPGRGRFIRRGGRPHVIQVARDPEVES
ncbi:type VII secretion protein EccCa [Sanguibacter inulinus]|uniref:Type VII secretion protein EccCa n=1 Tax=Sanguibacter inulinus TaxID=60922 RepID=A0A853EVA7_9MICO|nr:type VII secretion protein EccCa [Sanguibacter inulinus]MBF0722579.1 type VII secretion protein EccCa [Sanguibacter inulinus]NYS93724.1 type VII secretion protein EccCa [Sanguibacter inulinus]